MTAASGRPPLVAGNWKMNPRHQVEAVQLATAVRDATRELPVRTVVCPPFVFLPAVAEAVGPGSVGPGALGIGAQTMHAAEAGAYTGEVSPPMLAGLAQYVIIGHSERRRYAHETDDDVAAKVASAVAHGLVPIAAVGETGEERAQGMTVEVIDRQVRAAISRLDRIEGSGLVIAYEPVWAIGTGVAATPADAQDGAARIRAVLQEVDPQGAGEVPILYGGSCTPANAPQLFALPDVDGALVGGASLDAEAFTAIVRAAAERAA
ncbi:MAG TPA: triose-phosphate isomerase [candidate division Zixibacteria bacterium]|nr:triose-phosphate isomerase [candidate division Zixibacteria bacterium]